MKKGILITAMIAGLFLSGCGSDEKTAEAPQNENVPVAHEVAEMSHVEEVTEAHEEVVEETVDASGSVTEMVEEKTVEVEGSAAEMLEAIKGKAVDVVETSEEAASSLLEKKPVKALEGC